MQVVYNWDLTGCSDVWSHPRPTTKRGTGSREEAHILNLFDLNYIPPLCIYLVIVVSPMSSILWVHEPDVRGAKGLSGESTEYASDSYHLLEYLAVSSASVSIWLRGVGQQRVVPFSRVLRKVWDKRDDWWIALGLIICVMFRFRRTLFDDEAPEKVLFTQH